MYYLFKIQASPDLVNYYCDRLRDQANSHNRSPANNTYHGSLCDERDERDRGRPPVDRRPKGVPRILPLPDNQRGIFHPRPGVRVNDRGAVYTVAKSEDETRDNANQDDYDNDNADNVEKDQGQT